MFQKLYPRENQAEGTKKLKDTAGILLLQSLTVILQVFLFRFYDQNLGPATLGLLITIMTVMAWGSLLDFGIINSLRNRLPEFLNVGDGLDAQRLVSSSFFGFFKIISCMFLVCSLGCAVWIYALPRINPIKDLDGSASELYLCVILILSGTFVNLLFKLNGAISYALLKPVFAFRVEASFMALFLLLATVFVNLSDLKLLGIALAYFSASIIASGLSTALIFWPNKTLFPSVASGREYGIRQLVSSGKTFFIIQLGAVVMYSTDSVLIAALFDFEQVATYKINAKLFLLFTMAHGALMAPLWSRYTFDVTNKAYTKIFRRYYLSILLTCPFIVGVYVMWLVGNDILSVWFGHERYFDNDIMIALSWLTIIMCLTSTLTTVYNGTNQNHILARMSFVAAFLNVPLSIILVMVFGLGPEGVAYGSAVCLFPMLLLLALRLRSTVSKACGRQDVSI